MFDVTAQSVNDQEKIHGLDKIHWEKDSWKRLSLIGDETVINLQSTKVYVFSDSVLRLGRIFQHPDSNEAWKNRIAGVKSVRSYRDYDGINGEPTELEWNIFPGFTTLQLCGKINDLLSDLGQMSMFNDISCDRKGNKDECLANAGVVKVLARRFGVGQGSFIGPGSEKSGILQRIVHKEFGIILRKKYCWNSQKADILLSVQRLHCPGANSRAKDMENCRYTSLQMNSQLKQFFALSFLSISSASTEQWRLYVKNLRTIKMDRPINCSR